MLLTVKPVKGKDLFPIMKNILKVCEGVKFTVSSDSMRPILRKDKDQVVVAYSNGKDLKVGEIVLIEPSEGIYALRIIYKKTDLGYVVKRNKKDRDDWVIFPEHVIGVVIKIIRNGKKLNTVHKLFRNRRYKNIP